MARIRITVPPGFGKNTQRKFFQFLREGERVLERVGREYVKDIQNRAINPKTGKRYKRLKPSTIENRRRIASSNSVSPKYRARFPNLTITGEFLKSFRGDVASKGRFARTLVIEPQGKHPGYKQKRGGRSKRVDNSKIAQRMESLGRNVLSISQKRSREILETFRRLLRRTI